MTKLLAVLFITLMPFSASKAQALAIDALLTPDIGGIIRDDAFASKELAQVHIPFQQDEDLFYLRKWLFHQEGKAFATSDGFKTGFLQWSKAWSPVWNEVMHIDLPKTLKKVDCPVYFFVGKNDIQTSTRITQDYFEQLQAPRKGLFVFEQSGHQIHQDEPEKFQQAIIGTLPAPIVAR